MCKFFRIAVFSILTSFPAVNYADSITTQKNDSYSDAVLLKLGSGFCNLMLGLVEVPKNIISTTNRTNVLFGMTGGVIKGTAHAMGRTLSGAVDILTAPIGNKPMTHPVYVWENWYNDTTYGPYFLPENNTAQPISPAPALPPPTHTIKPIDNVNSTPRPKKRP